MSFLTAAQYRDASTAFKVLFFKTIQKALPADRQALIDALCLTIPTTDREIQMSWFDGLPMMRKWRGSRKPRQLHNSGATKRLVPWENSLEVLSDDVMFDKLGAYMSEIKKIANEVPLLPWRECQRIIADGFTGTLYGNALDGNTLFSASHAEGTNTGTAALTDSALRTAIGVFNSQIDPATNDLLGYNATHLWFHPSLETTVMQILDRTVILDGTGVAGVSNEMYKKLQPLKMSGMPASAANYWGLLAVDEMDDSKPVVFLDNASSASFDYLDDPKSSMPAFMKRILFYGMSKWGLLVPGRHTVIWGSNGTT